MSRSPYIVCLLLTLAGVSACGGGGFGLVALNVFEDTPNLEVQPEEEIVFDARPAATGSGEESLTIRGVGNSNVILETIDVVGQNAGAFRLPDLPLPRQLRPGAEFPVAITFRPPSVGNFVAEILITAANTDVSVSRALRGTGCNDQNGDGVCDNQAPPAPDGVDTGELDSGW